MVAASAPDLDGLSLLGGWECYYDWHHVLMHNLPFAVILAALLACFSRPKLTAFAVYFGLVHLHFALDLLGSGSDWGVDYWRPFSPVFHPLERRLGVSVVAELSGRLRLHRGGHRDHLLEKADDSRVPDAETES